jgi:hypothetical protein
MPLPTRRPAEELYRYETPAGVGVYESKLRGLTPQARRQLLGKLREAWALPNPGDLRAAPPTRSYFTPRGAQMYRQHHAGLLGEDGELVQERALRRDALKSILYEDDFQVVAPAQEKAAGVVHDLQRAKEHSDARRYGQKHKLLRELLAAHGTEFEVDAPEGPYWGLTHVPSQFRIHAPRGLVEAAGLGVQKVASLYTQLCKLGKMVESGPILHDNGRR